MAQYKVNEKVFTDLKKQIFLRSSTLIIVAFAANFLIFYLGKTDNSELIKILPVAIIVGLAAMGFGTYREYKHQTNLLSSYRLSLESNLISREQLNTPSVSIYINEIEKIIQYPTGALVIKSKNTNDQIIIPAKMENYDDLVQELNKIHPIQVGGTSSTAWRIKSILASVSGCALMVCVYTQTNKVVVSVSGILLLGILVWGLVEIQKSKQLDTRIKRMSWWVILPFLSVLAKVIMCLSA